MANVKQIKQKTSGTLFDIEDTQARGDIVAEITNRIDADTTLQEKIDNEVTARTNSDNTINQKITSEITNRTNADKALDDKVKAETEARTSADNALNQKIVQETTNRTNVDNTLQEKINTNKNDISELKTLVESYNDQVDGKIQVAKTQIDTDFTVKLNTQRSEIDSEIQRVETQANANYKTVNERVDNLVATDPGSTGDNAELLDIRLGYDGNTYPTAGAAVRGQISELKGEIGYKVEEDYSNYIIQGKYIKGSGEIVSSSEYNVVKLLPVHGYSEIEFKDIALSTDKWGIAGYGKSKEYIKQLDSNTGSWYKATETCTISDDIYFVSFCYKTSYAPVITCNGIKKVIYDTQEKVEYEEKLDIDDYIYTGKYVNKTTGNLSNDGSFCSVYKLPVHFLKNINITDMYVNGNVSICSYDEEGNYISNIATKFGNKITCDFIIDDDIYFISFSYLTTNKSTITVNGLKNKVREINYRIKNIENNYKPIYYFRLPELQPNKRVRVNGEIISTTDGFSIIPWIKIEPNCNIYLKNIYNSESEGYRCAYYDKDFNFISYVNGYSGYSTKNLVLDTTPSNAGYLSLTVKDIDYKNGNVANVFSYDTSLFGKDLSSNVKESLVVWVDDDGNPEGIERIKSVCDALNITATLACMGEECEKSETYKKRLLELEEAGLQIVYHGYSNSAEEEAIWSNENTNVRSFEKVITKGLRALSDFQNINYLVTTHGTNNDIIQNLAPKYFKCLCSAWEGVNSKEKIDNPYDGRYRYNLGRTDLTNCSYDDFIAKVDGIRKMNDLVILVSHCAPKYCDWETNRVQDKMQYILNKGIKVVTLKEAIDYYFGIK